MSLFYFTLRTNTCKQVHPVYNTDGSYPRHLRLHHNEISYNESQPECRMAEDEMKRLTHLRRPLATSSAMILRQALQYEFMTYVHTSVTIGEFMHGIFHLLHPHKHKHMVYHYQVNIETVNVCYFVHTLSHRVPLLCQHCDSVDSIYTLTVSHCVTQQ